MVAEMGSQRGKIQGEDRKNRQPDENPPQFLTPPPDYSIRNDGGERYGLTTHHFSPTPWPVASPGFLSLLK